MAGEWFGFHPGANTNMQLKDICMTSLSNESGVCDACDLSQASQVHMKDTLKNKSCL